MAERTIHPLAAKLLALNRRAREMLNMALTDAMNEGVKLTQEMTETGEAWEKAGFPTYSDDGKED